MRRRRVLALLLLLFSSAGAMAQSKDGVVKGIKYTINPANEGPRIKQNDVVTFNFIAKTEKDSVLQSSYAMGQPAKIQCLPAPTEPVDLMNLFVLLTTNDVITARIPTDSLFKNNEQQRPPFFPKGSSLVYTIKIERIQSLDEAIAERDKANEALKMAEKDSITKYIAKNKLTPKVTASGLNYVITKPSAKATPVAGDTIFVNYTGRTLDGKVFDSSIEAEAIKAGLNQPGRTYEPISFPAGMGEVIKGWDEGLMLVNEGGKATLIIPSDLAYGPEGKGPAIGPFATLIFDVEVVKIVHAKK